MNRYASNLKSGSGARRRGGTTTVEFSVCLPLVLLLFFGAIEFSRVNMLRHTLTAAAYEGARRGIVPGATADDVRTTATDVLGCAFATGYTIDVAPATITAATTEVTVTISLPIEQNSWIACMFFSGKTLSKSFTLRRERYDTAMVP
jgi:Flp pilus assembly protein TadG